MPMHGNTRFYPRLMGWIFVQGDEGYRRYARGRYEAIDGRHRPGVSKFESFPRLWLAETEDPMSSISGPQPHGFHTVPAITDDY